MAQNLGVSQRSAWVSCGFPILSTANMSNWMGSHQIHLLCFQIQGQYEQPNFNLWAKPWPDVQCTDSIKTLQSPRLNSERFRPVGVNDSPHLHVLTDPPLCVFRSGTPPWFERGLPSICLGRTCRRTSFVQHEPIPRAHPSFQDSDRPLCIASAGPLNGDLGEN